MALEQKTEKIRILVAGINYAPNQITRTIEKYGCVPIHVNGDKNSSFPHFCDAAIVVSSYTSHKRYHDVKEIYKRNGKRCFLAGNGFSEIKEQFEKFLIEKRGYAMPEGSQPVLAGQLTVPAAWLAKEQEKENAMKEEEDKPRFRRYTPDELRQIHTVIRNKLKITPAVEELNRLKIKKSNGTDFKYTDVAQIRISPQYKEFIGEVTLKKEAVTAKPSPQVKQTQSEPSSDGMSLIQQVTVSSLPLQEKIELIHKITLGEIRHPETTERIIVDNQLVIERVSILRPKAENPHVTLTREQADLVLSNLAAINNFHEGKTL